MLLSHLLKHHLSARVFSNKRLLSLLACVFVWLNMLQSAPVLDLKSSRTLALWSDSSLHFILNSPQTLSAIHHLLPASASSIIMIIKKNDHNHSFWDFGEGLWRSCIQALSDIRKSLVKRKLKEFRKCCVKFFPGFKVQNLALFVFWTCHSPRTHQCSSQPSLTRQWVIHTHPAGTQSIWASQSHLKAGNTLAVSSKSKAPKWIEQDWYIVFFPRNETFACCGLQGSFSANWMRRETFPVAWWLLQDLLFAARTKAPAEAY